MKLTYSSPILKPLLLLLLLLFFLSVILLFSFQLNLNTIKPPPPPTPPSSTQPYHDNQLLKMRSGYASYEEYIKHQLNKTLNPKLRHVWATRDWDRKVRVFSSFFSALKSRDLLSNSSKSLCVGARMGQEVAALRSVGVLDSVGIDLVPCPPLVLKGDFHAQPFADATFDFEFSNVFDHALYPEKFVREIERTLRPGGVCVLHVALDRRGDKYSANDLFGVEGVLALFRDSELVGVRKVDGFGLDTEIVTRKKTMKKYN